MSRRGPLAQAAMFGLILLLAAAWVVMPEREEALTYSAHWYAAFARSLSRQQGPAADLQPLASLASRPLVQFEGTGFLGCDLSTQGTRLLYVTRWERPANGTKLEAQLDFIVGGEALSTDRWWLDAGEHRSEVPAAFFGEAPWEVWLRVMGPLGERVAPAGALLPVVDGRVRICN